MKLLPKDHTKIFTVAAYIVFGALFVFFVLPYVVKYMLPFIVAAVISVVITPIIDFITEKMHIPRKISTIVTVLIVLAAIGFFMFNLVYQAVYFLQDIALKMPEMLNHEFTLPDWVNKINAYLIRFPEPMQDFVNSIKDNLISNISEIIQPATTATIKLARSIATKLPTILVFTIVTILATYFINYDKQTIVDFAKKHFSHKVLGRVKRIKNGLYDALGAYVRAQLIMMCIMFMVLLIGFGILGIESPLFVAFVTAIVDAIPILGTGTVLIPWAILSLVTGNFAKGIGLAILYVCAFVIRQFTEPRIVSSQIGLHPLVTLMSMYAGLLTFGVFGMILGPITAIVVIKAIEIEKQNDEEVI